jgi:hypothetical protein
LFSAALDVDLRHVAPADARRMLHEIRAGNTDIAALLEKFRIVAPPPQLHSPVVQGGPEVRQRPKCNMSHKSWET